MDQPTDVSLAQTYRAATDAWLMDLAMSYDTLTTPAQAALRAEFARRGLEPPILADEVPPLDSEPLVTVRQYRELADAQMARGALESAGIPCFLRDENMIRMQWTWSNLIGGVRLQVRPEDREAAEEVLAQPIPASFDTDDSHPFQQPRCPKCGSLDIHYQATHERAGLASIIVFVPLPIPKRAWICNVCRAEWRDEEEKSTR